MKLIDLLVQELPKRGGWPAGVDAVEQDSEGQLFEMESDYCSDFKLKNATTGLQMWLLGSNTNPHSQHRKSQHGTVKASR